MIVLIYTVKYTYVHMYVEKCVWMDVPEVFKNIRICFQLEVTDNKLCTYVHTYMCIYKITYISMYLAWVCTEHIQYTYIYCIYKYIWNFWKESDFLSNKLVDCKGWGPECGPLHLSYYAIVNNLLIQRTTCILGWDLNISDIQIFGVLNETDMYVCMYNWSALHEKPFKVF